MQQRVALWILSVGILWVTGCATKPYNAFKVPEPQLRQQVKIIAVQSTVVPHDIPKPTEVQSRLDALIAESVQKAGFQVVPATSVAEIESRIRGEMGDIFNPQTGKADEEKLKKVAELTRRELVDKYHADAILYSRIIVVSAAFNDWRAAWDGVREDTTVGSSLMQKFGSYGIAGKISALSLWVWLKNINGDLLYSDGGGLQLLSKVVNGRFVERPVTELFQDPMIESRAVSIAFQPLLPPQPKEPRASHNDELK